ncbi:MAG: YfhO family protein [Oscillospiraceae bacterium]|nr:YfhO family protein [Oscillospiraceae bacterium]
MTLKTMAGRSLRGLETAGGFLSRPRKPRLLYLTAFFLPVLIMAFMWTVCGVVPFGSKMILAHDQWHQYYPFFLDLRSRLQNGQSLLHSWTTGMGTNYLSLFAYYLASPLNLPAFLLPDGLVMLWYNLMVLVRLGLSGLFCAYFLKKVFGREEFAVVAFSTAYAFCAFLMGYYWNAIWLDTVALLPLVTLGTFELLKERRCVLYVVSLSLAVYCSYYIGLFVCIFVLLIFIGWHIVNWDDLAGFWTRFWRIALFTLVALGMTAFLTVPAYLGLQSTSSAINKFPKTNAMNIIGSPEMSYQAAIRLIDRGELHKLFTFFGKEAPSYADASTFTGAWIGPHEALLSLRLGYPGAFLASLRLPLQGMARVLSNAGTLAEPTSMEGLPNIFCGFITLIMACVYLLCRRIPLRERIFTLLLLLFFGASFLFRTLDYLWHGMHFPNMLPYRFSFLWSFTVIFMAFRAYTQIEHLSHWRAVAMIVPVTVLLYCVIRDGSKLSIAFSTVVATAALAGLLFYAFRMVKKELFVLGLCVCMLLESLGCAILGVRKVGFTDSSYYPSKKADTAAVVAAMKQREAESVDLWRAELAHKQTLNDGTLLNYPGVSVFSSAANCRISAFLQSIGMAASVAGNRYIYQEADPFTNLLLGVKYLIDRSGRNLNADYFRQVYRSGDVVLLENRAYLSLGYLVGDKALEYDASQNAGLPFERLNRLFRSMTGLEDELFVPFPMSGLQAVGNAVLSGKTSTSFQVKGKCDDENYVEASFEIPTDGLLCIYSKGSGVNDVTFFLNGEKKYTWSDTYGYNRCMGRFFAGDQVSLRYRAKKEDTNGSVTLGAALFQSELFDQAYELLSERSMIPTAVTDTRVEGAIRVYEPGLLYLSIPNDDGWNLTVDGNKARITPVGDAMIAVHLEPGLHAIVLDYEAPGLSLGLKISVISLAVFLAFLIVALLSRFTSPPIVKVPVTLADPRQSDAESAPDAPPAAEPMPPRPGTDMPPLDLTQHWSARETAVIPTAVPTDPRSPAAPQSEPRADAPAADAEQALGAAPARPELLATTGVFDPTRIPPERESSSSFNRLVYLDRLEKLLEAEAERKEQDSPAEPADGDAGGE